MSRKQGFAFAMLVVILAAGTIAHWFIPQANNYWQGTAISYISLLATLLGFGAVVYQLRETERAIQEGTEQPALRLEVLEFVAAPNQYAGQGTNRLALYPARDNPSIIGVHCAFRIVNEGSKPASHLYLTFDFRRQESNRTVNESSSRVNVYYNKKEQNYVRAAYADCSEENGYQVGWTMQFPPQIIAYPDLDRPVIAEVDLTMLTAEYESNYEIHYRIQSYEGNKYLTKAKQGKRLEVQDQIYEITFDRAPEA
jgi:hypothetical protein